MSPPFNKDRADAQMKGSVTYIGRPCWRCDSNLRLVRNSACVPCERERQQKRSVHSRVAPPFNRVGFGGGARYAALVAGFSKYEGAACRNCGGVVRYTSNRHCVACKSTAQQATGSFLESMSPCADIAQQISFRVYA